MRCVIRPAMREKNGKHLVLVRGGDSALGPISRMDLWGRVPTYTPLQVGIMVGAKVLLMGAILYYLLG